MPHRRALGPDSLGIHRHLDIERGRSSQSIFRPKAFPMSVKQVKVKGGVMLRATIAKRRFTKARLFRSPIYTDYLLDAAGSGENIGYHRRLPFPCV